MTDPPPTRAQRDELRRLHQALTDSGEWIINDSPLWYEFAKAASELAIPLLDECDRLKEQRDKLLHVVRYVGSSLAQSDEIPLIVLRDLRERCQQVNQELNLP